MSPVTAAIHIAAGVAGLIAALTGLVASRRNPASERFAHVVMSAAMALCLGASLELQVPVAVLLVLVVASWGAAWSAAVTARRTGVSLALPVDLMATGALLLFLPMGHLEWQFPVGTHLHSSGGGFTLLLGLGTALSWTVVSLLRCRSAPSGEPSPERRTVMPSVCAAGMAASMLVMAAVAV